MSIFWPTNTTDITDEIREAIGRNVTILITASGIPCTTCNLNPVSNLSTNPFCPECEGFYWKNTTSGYVVKAHVYMGGFGMGFTGGLDFQNRVAGGWLPFGGVAVQIKYTTENEYAVKHAIHYIVDGRTFLQDDVTYLGVPNINRIIITLKEQDN